MTLVGILLTALVVPREWERGTMGSQLVTPLRPVDPLLGKVLPYLSLGMLGMGLSWSPRSLCSTCRSAAPWRCSSC
jgi:ABC-2 type transport system permease protein